MGPADLTVIVELWIKKMDRFNWDDLKYFLSVVRAGRLTKAAKRLGADHATVSRRITALETALQAKLFERSPQGYALTAQGERLLSKAEAVEGQAMKVATEIAGADVTPTGTVRIGCPEGLGTIFLAQRLSKLSKRFPNLDLQLVMSAEVTPLLKRDIDILFSLDEIKDVRIVTKKFIDVVFGLFASRSYLSHNPAITSLADLENHTLISYIDRLYDFPEFTFFRQLLEKKGEQLSSPSTIAQLRMTSAGGGVCLMPYFAAASDPSLVPVLPDEVSVTLAYWLSVLSSQLDIVRNRTVISFFNREIKTAQSLFVPEFWDRGKSDKHDCCPPV